MKTPLNKILGIAMLVLLIPLGILYVGIMAECCKLMVAGA